MSGAEAARWGWRRKLLLQLALLPLLLLAVELLVRGYGRATGRPYDAETTRREILGTLDAMTSPLPRPPEDRDQPFENIKDAYVLHPYYGFTAKLSMEETGEWTRLFRAGVPDETFVIMVLGGSVAGTVGHGLAEMVETDPRLAEREVIVMNLGRGANRQPQQLVRAMFMLGLGAEPDAIVNVDGFNEAAFGMANVRKDVHPLYPYWPRWGHLTLTDGPTEEGLALAAESLVKQDRAFAYGRAVIDGPRLSSAVLGRWTMSRFRALALEWTAAQDRYADHLAEGAENPAARGPDFPGDEEEAMETVVRTWFDCSVALQKFCDARGIKYVHVLQPTLYDEGSKPLTAEELERGRHSKAYRNGVMLGYPMMRARGPELVALGVDFIDLSMRFEGVEPTIYTDYCHFNAFGNNLVSADVLDALLE